MGRLSRDRPPPFPEAGHPARLLTGISKNPTAKHDLVRSREHRRRLGETESETH